LLLLPELKPPPQNHFHQQMIGAAGHTDAGAEVELPVRTEVQVDGRENGLPLVTERVETSDGAERTVILDANRDLFRDVVAYLDVGAKVTPLLTSNP
jgi:hypothetical protein